MKAAGVGSCFYCFSYVLFEDTKQWTDKGQTAICPCCKIDSVATWDYIFKNFNRYAR